MPDPIPPEHDPGRTTPMHDATKRMVHRGAHPERIGPYRILQVLGEGGMGVVYEAEQTEPVRRRVALKVVRAGMDTREIVARFEAERQALAVMSHPSIAKVLDAGASETGEPYFVMELVKGIPFTEYCDERALSLRARLELFIGVCEAVQHAHQKGVIHRDLKPSNVLVTEQDGRPTPKVIDFGIAKAVNQPLTDKTLVTEHGTVMGTLAYMSPEQAESGSLDIDTRADVYSLGVMLYEMLVGELPMDPSTMAPYVFIAELVMRETDPPRPSTRIAANPDTARRAALRATDSAALRKMLKGDLDWIVLKALDKDRARRYDSAAAFGLDLQRYLDDEPVLARQPTAGYRFRKFARRNRTAVTAAAAVVLALVGGVVLATTGLVRARTAEAQARRDAATSSQVSGFLQGLFAVNDPSEARGNTVTAREILDAGAARIGRELAGQPLVRANLQLTMGRVYASLGLLPQAVPLLDSAVSTRERLLDPDAPKLADALVARAAVARSRGQFADAAKLTNRAITIYEKADGPDALPIADALLEGDAGPEAYRRVWEIRRAHLAGNDPKLAEAYDVMATYLGPVRPDSAALFLQRAWQIARAADDPRQAGWMVDAMYARRISADSGIAIVREALRLDEHFRGPESWQAPWLLGHLGYQLQRAGRWAEAEHAQREAIRIRHARWGNDAIQLTWLYRGLLNVLRHTQQWDSLAATSREYAAYIERTQPAYGPIAQAMVGVALARAERDAEALRVLQPMVAKVETPAPLWAGAAFDALAAIAVRQRRIADARRYYQRAVQDMRETRVPTLMSYTAGGALLPAPKVVAQTLGEWARFERRAGRAAEAARLAAEARAPLDPWAMAVGWSGADPARPDSLLWYARAAVKAGRMALPANDQPAARALGFLGSALAGAGDDQAAAEVRGELVQLADSQPAGRAPQIRATVALGRRARYAAALRRAGEFETAAAVDARTGAFLDSILTGNALGTDVSEATLNAICWWGALSGHAKRVLTTCDAAVAAADSASRPSVRDSRGVARMVAGDLAGAAADFEAYLAATPNPDGQRRYWLRDLKRGRNPLTLTERDRLVLT